VYKRQIYHIAESNRIQKIDSVARIESNRNFFSPNWNALRRIAERVPFSSARLCIGGSERNSRKASAAQLNVEGGTCILSETTAESHEYTVYYFHKTLSVYRSRFGALPSIGSAIFAVHTV